MLPLFERYDGLPALLNERSRYIREWVRVFYATLFIEEDRQFIDFMFQQRPSSHTTWSQTQRTRRMTRTSYPLLLSLDVLMMMRQDPLVQPESLLLLLLLLRSLSLILSLLFFRGSLTSRTGLLQLS